MSPEAIAAIVAAIITAVGTIVATRFQDIVDLFRGSPRQISGEWDGETYTLDRGPVNDSEYE